MLVFKTMLLLIIACAITECQAQVFQFKELTTDQVRRLNPDKTVVIIPGGLMEEHGPYLPLYTDGYTNEALAHRVADSIYASTQHNVLIFPTIPVGVGSPEAFAGVTSFPGVVYVRPETLRAVFMDIGDMLGRQGIRFIFVVFKHGARFHNEALDQACAYFNDSYPGKKMVALTALEYNTWKDKTALMDEREAEENGIDIHAGMDETSRMLFNRPQLVNDGYKTAVPFTVRSWDDFAQVTQNKDWKGYYGSPRLASKERGQIIMQRLTHNLSELAIKIISGFDHSKLPRFSDSQPNKSDVKLDSTIKRLSENQGRQQREWLGKKGIED